MENNLDKNNNLTKKDQSLDAVKKEESSTVGKTSSEQILIKYQKEHSDKATVSQVEDALFKSNVSKEKTTKNKTVVPGDSKKAVSDKPAILPKERNISSTISDIIAPTVSKVPSTPSKPIAPTDSKMPSTPRVTAPIADRKSPATPGKPPSTGGFSKGTGGSKPNKRKLIVIISAVLVLCLAAGLIYYFISMGKDKPTYQITFNSQDGSAVAPISGYQGQTITAPAPPTKAGYEFGGWFTDKDCTEQYSFDIMPAKNITLYAKWTQEETEVSYTIIFNSNGGTILDPATAQSGDPITAPANPTKEGYIFGGWFTDNDTFNNRFSFTTISEQNITLYARWYSMEEEIPISSAEDLKIISLFGKYYLSANINLNGLEWAPVGDKDNPFCGIFDGNGYTISNFKITIGRQYIGLFGYNTGEIANLGLTDFNINVNYSETVYAGGLVAYNYQGTITDCYAAGDFSVSGPSAYAGELVGYNSNGTITECYGAGNINATINSSSTAVYAGGLVGRNSGIITNCYATGNVSVTSKSNSSAYAGGLVGDNDSGAINACYATGNISAVYMGTDSFTSVFAGGLVGKNSGTLNVCHAIGAVSAIYTVTSSSYRVYAGGLVGYSSGTITDCYSMGEVSATASSSYRVYAGGLVGDNSGGTITGCYATGAVSATVTSSYYAYAGGLVGSSSGTITNCYATGAVRGNYVGGLVGDNNGGTITACYATGAVSGDRAGGLVGSSGGTITNCYATGDVSSDYNAGGLVGNNEGSITYCYATGDVSSSNYAGGLVGGNSGGVTDCYATGAVSSSNYAGGLVGYNGGTITGCYTTGDVNAASNSSSAYVGGLVGYNNGTITGCYRYSEQTFYRKEGSKVYTTPSNTIGTATSLANLQSEQWVIDNLWGYDAEIWIFAEGSFPTLRGDSSDIFNSVIEIKTVEELLKLSGTGSSRNYMLMSNIDLNGTEWTPISYFRGTFDGNGFTISNFKITTERQYAGFFGYNTGEIKNLGLTDFTINVTYSATVYAGGLAGYNDCGVITDCYATGDVSASGSGTKYAGGLVGRNSGTITNCYAAGDISATASDRGDIYTGGLVGRNSGIITNCYATGAVSASSYYEAYAGGLVGDNSGTIVDCYATGNVNATSSLYPAYAGGLVGSNSGAISNSYYAEFGFVTGAGEIVTIAELASSDWYINTLGYDIITWQFNEGYYPKMIGDNTPWIAVPTSCPIGSIGGNPIAIHTVNDLTNISLTKSYILMNNIDLGGVEWTPLGTSSNPYRGLFNGNGYTISNFKITLGKQYIGFFGYSTGEIKNLGLTDFYIDVTYSGTIYVGGLAGFNSGTINNCYAAGAVSATTSGYGGAYAGGLVGYNDSGTVNVCYATGVVSASSYYSAYAGGLVGNNEYGTIASCYATGDVSAICSSSSSYAGGLVGDNHGMINACYATGDVSAESSSYSADALAGGLIGRNENGAVNACYATGDVSATSSSSSAYAGGLTGFSSGITSNSYYAEFGYVAGVGKLVTILELCSTDWYINTLGYDISTWQFNDGYYPKLIADNTSWIAIPTSYSQGSIGNPIEIHTANDLISIASNRCYMLMNNIDLGDIEWAPLNYFSIFNGNGYTISNFMITIGKQYIGFFGYNSGKIANLGLTDFYIDVTYSDTVYAGGLVGHNYFGRITNCYTTGAVSATSSSSSARAGGLVGYNTSSGTISNCYATGDINATSYYNAYTGGLVGDNDSGTITNCYATGDISAISDNSRANAGGLVGNNCQGTITDCYATGDVSGDTAGGLIGDNDDGTINACYATGAVSAITTISSFYIYAGGLVGFNRGFNNGSTITNCYATGDISAISDNGNASAGGLVGHVSSGTISNCYAVGDVSAIRTGASGSVYAGGLAGYVYSGTTTGCYRYSGQTFYRKIGSSEYTTPSNTTGTATSLANLQSGAWIKANLGWGEYVSPQDLTINPDNVWVFGAEVFPVLYWQV